MQPYTFSFNGINSSVFGLEYDTLTDDLVPNRRNDRMDIDHRHGTFVSDSGVRMDRVVSFRVTWKSDKPLDRYILREIAYWLRGSGELRFDIESDKYYNARMDNATQLALARLFDKTDGIMRNGSFFLQFVCEPFAHSEKTKKALVAGRNDFDYNGTEKGYPIITIRNHTGNPMPVPGFRISVQKRSSDAQPFKINKMIKPRDSENVDLWASAINLSRLNIMQFNLPDLSFDILDDDALIPSDGLEPSTINIQQFNAMRFNANRNVIENIIEQTEEQSAIILDLALGIDETVVIDNKEETVTLIKADTTMQNIRHLLTLLNDEYLTFDRESVFIDIEQTQAHDVQVNVEVSERWL